MHVLSPQGHRHPRGQRGKALSTECCRTQPCALGTIRTRRNGACTLPQVDVLPAIPIFNFASMVGVPFVDKTVRVETLSKAAVPGQCFTRLGIVYLAQSLERQHNQYQERVRVRSGTPA